MKRIAAALLTTLLITTILLLPASAAGDASRTVHNLINGERSVAGFGALTWDSELEQAARQRAREISVHYTSDHTRPDGSSYATVSNLVWGENTAYGYRDAEDLVAAWLRSTGHKRNIFKSSYTITAVAYVETDDAIYWVQLFGNGQDNSSWSGIAAREATASVADDTAEGVDSKEATGPLRMETVAAVGGVTGGAVDGDALSRQLDGALRDTDADGVAIRVTGAERMERATIHRLAELAAARGKIAVVQADTLSEGGTHVQGRLEVEPGKLTGLSGPLLLEVGTEGSAVQPIRELMERFYTQPMAFLRLAHNGGFGGRLGVAVKVDLDALDTEQLLFYSYNRSENTCLLLRDTAYTLDENGYLHFYTEGGGEIVITDRPLGQ